MQPQFVDGHLMFLFTLFQRTSIVHRDCIDALREHVIQIIEIFVFCLIQCASYHLIHGFLLLEEIFIVVFPIGLRELFDVIHRVIQRLLLLGYCFL